MSSIKPIINILSAGCEICFNILLCEIASVILITAIMFLFNVFNNRPKSELLKQQYNFFNQQLKYQNEHYHALYSAQKETRQIRHDIKNHLIALNGLINQNRIDEAKRYIEQLTGAILSTENIVDTGIPTMDAVIAAKIQKASQCQTKIEYKIKIEHEILIDSMDLALILANALDNAIEAASKIDDDKELIIQLNILNTAEYLSIRVENPTKNNVDTQNMITDKQEKQNHGFGIQKIKNTVQKYMGSTDIDFDEHSKTFCISLLLKNMEM